MESIAGWWTLLSWKQIFDDGRIVFPFGESATGRLIYSTGGNFSIFISRPGRPAFQTGGQWTADASEKAASYDGVLAYIGRYEVCGAEMHHHVEASLFPDWEGHTQIRQARITGTSLILQGRMEEGSPHARTAELVWRRLAEAS